LGEQNVSSLPSSVAQLFRYVAGLAFDAQPDYERCRGFFAAELRQTGGKIDLSSGGAVNGKAATAAKKKKSASPLKPVVVAKKRKSASLSPVKKAKSGVNGTAAGRRKAIVDDSVR
jgi:hypothetical protein